MWAFIIFVWTHAACGRNLPTPGLYNFLIQIKPPIQQKQISLLTRKDLFYKKKIITKLSFS